MTLLVDEEFGMSKFFGTGGLWLPSWETNIYPLSRQKLEDDFPVAQVGYVSCLKSTICYHGCLEYAQPGKVPS